jgi:tetratricopeptide (TPR) repeat protein
VTTAVELWEMLGRARTMPYTAARIAVCDQLLRHVDQAGDAELAFVARMEAADSYVYGGEPARAFAPFAWCLDDFDHHPGPYHQRYQRELLWLFKIMVGDMTDHPDIPLDRTEAALDDMERRYRDAGKSLQAVYKRRYLVADHLGSDRADRWYELWHAAERDDLSDCAGCDPTSAAEYLNARGRWSETVALAEPVLAGHLTCYQQPQGILNALTVAYVRTGEPEKAADAHRRAYQRQRDNLADLWELGEHIRFCARTGNEHRGFEILQRHIDWLEKAPSPMAEMMFAAHAAMLLHRLSESGHGDMTVRRGDRGEITAAGLAPEMAARARALAARFDARNGNSHQGSLVEAAIGAQPYGMELQLSPSRHPLGGAVSSLVEAVVAAETEEQAAVARLELAKGYRRADDRIIEAIEVAEEALLRFDSLGLAAGGIETRHLLVELYRTIDDDERALTCYRELIERLADDLEARAAVGEEMAHFLKYDGRWAAAADAFLAAAADRHTVGHLVHELRLLRHRVTALYCGDFVAEAEQTAQLSAELFGTMPPEPGAVVARWMTAYELGRVLIDAERYPEAIAQLTAAVGHLRGVADDDEVDRVESALGEAIEAIEGENR